MNILYRDEDDDKQNHSNDGADDLEPATEPPRAQRSAGSEQDHTRMIWITFSVPFVP